MKNEIMKNAWTIAKSGQALFGGSAAVYFSEALRIAWAEIKQENEMDLTKLTLDELNTLKLDLNAEIDSRSTEPGIVTVDIAKTTASGRRESWLKHVTSVNPAEKGGYAYDGEFLNPGECELTIGAIVIECIPCGSVKNGYKEGVVLRVQANGDLDRISECFDWKTEAVSFRQEVEKCFN